jgi:hypothetical protein
VGLHIKDLPPLKRLLEEVSVALHIKDLPPVKHLLEGERLIDTIESCGIRNPGELVGGFCQALFHQRPNPTEHTRFVTEALARAGAKYTTSHELFFGHRASELAVCEFIERAVDPLREGDGCVPVVITGLEATDERVVEIFAVPRPLPEPILVRLLVTERSIAQAVALQRQLIENVRTMREVPGWWPLFQGVFNPGGWEQFRVELGEDWAHTCCAVNPFTSQSELDMIAAQAVVAQIAVGDADGFNDEVALPSGMKITGAPDGARYDLRAYLARIRQLPNRPVFILLGPTRPEWDDDHNVRRVSRALEVLRHHEIAL